MYGLRMINKDGFHYNFKWPLEVGATVKCPDWSPEPECGGGLHLLPEGIGEYALLDGYYWCVVEFDENQMVRIDDHKAKVPECRIVYLSERPDGLKEFFDFSKFGSQEAYGWAKWVGDREIMRDKIAESRYAYYWASDIGDRELMRDRITDIQWAYYWARDIGDKEIMIDKISDSQYAYWWGLNIGDREIMRDRITESEHAYWWAIIIGDVEMMRKRITDPVFIDMFEKTTNVKKSI